MDFTFGELLRGFRQRASLTRAALAADLNVHINTIGIWERGQYLPKDREIVLRLATELALKPNETDHLLRAADFPPEFATPTPSTPRHQIRPPVADFVGRVDEVSQLVSALQSARAPGSGLLISGVQGMGGVGKTELAYRISHDLRATFPDGQIVIEMRGASRAPLPVEQALQHAIRAFTPDTKLPANLQELQDLYRSLLHDRRVLIVADDARDAPQVRPLIPPAGSALIVTSRQRFTLPGMLVVNLEQLGPDEAVVLLRSICARLSDEDARTLAQVCGYLPLALRISASVLHNDPALPVAAYLRHLADERQRLAHLRDPDEPQLDVAATLALSYDLLDAAAQSMFRQLGVLVADFSTDLALAVVAAPAGADAAAMLRLLLRRNLVMYDAVNACWRLHDLVRDLARGALEAAGELEATTWRYARAVVGRVQALAKQFLDGGDGSLSALAQFDAEQPHIDAVWAWAVACAGQPEGDRLILDVARAARGIGELRYDARHERIPQWEHARAAARRLGDQRGESAALNSLGISYLMLGDIRRAITCYEQQMSSVRAMGDRRGEGGALNSLAVIYVELGYAQRALPYAEQSVAIARELGDPHGQAITLNNLGNVYLKLGDPQRALGYFEQAAAAARAIGSRRIEGVALNNQGSACADLGDLQRALALCEAALAIMRTIGDRREEGYVLLSLARALALRGDVCAADCFAQALAILQEVGDRANEADGKWLFGLALAQRGQREQALPLLRAAVAYKAELGHAQASEYAAGLARLEAGEALPVCLPPASASLVQGEDQHELPRAP